MSEENKLQGNRKDQAGTCGTRTSDYSLVAPECVPTAWIQSLSIKAAHPRARTGQS